MGKQEVIDLFKCFAYYIKPVSFTKNRNIINSEYFQFREQYFTNTIIKKQF